MPDRIAIAVTGSDRTSALVYGAATGIRMHATLVLAHGAGAGHESRFIVQFASGLSSAGVDVLTFNFLYAEQRRRVPDRAEKLEACFRAVIAAARNQPSLSENTLFIGGKSMGGRIATHLAASPDAPALGFSGIVLLGYPLHPPGKPAQLRSAHLPAIRVPMLIVQGSRDIFGTPDELRPVLDRMTSPVTLHVVDGGDHSLAPRRNGAAAADDVHRETQRTIGAWIRNRTMAGG